MPCRRCAGPDIGWPPTVADAAVPGRRTFLVRWWHRRTLRARITLLATAVFTVALILAGVILLVTVGKSLLNTLDSSAERTGTDVAALVNTGRLPSQVLAGSGGASMVQVVDADNQVLAASPGVDTAVSMVTPEELTRLREGRHLTVSGARASQDDPIRVVGVAANTRAGPRTVLVGTDLGRVFDSSRLLQRALLLGGPLIVIAMAALTWWVVGLTLRPVGELRRGAAALSASGLARSRLPVPDAQDEIHSLALTLNGMLDRLDTSTGRQRRFVGDAAHELRSPIASLRLQLEVAQRLDQSPAMRELTDDALLDVDRLTHLIDDLLALARSDERGGVNSRLPVRLDELAAAIVNAYRDARIPVQLVQTESITVLGDKDGLHRVLVNLIDNAVRYATGQVSVAVYTQPPAGTGFADAVLCVSDDGPGVPANKRERVFDRFYRLDTARSRAEGGTGLGLSIVREIITAHGGTVQLRDNEPGLIAEVTLPITS
jgi:signal transduction histidine kinase